MMGRREWERSSWFSTRLRAYKIRLTLGLKNCKASEMTVALTEGPYCRNGCMEKQEQLLNAKHSTGKASVGMDVPE